VSALRANANTRLPKNSKNIAAICIDIAIGCGLLALQSHCCSLIQLGLSNFDV
jgi:hypothetical protein